MNRYGHVVSLTHGYISSGSRLLEVVFVLPDWLDQKTLLDLITGKLRMESQRVQSLVFADNVTVFCPDMDALASYSAILMVLLLSILISHLKMPV